jgi:membrane protease YdiL (CAAX protease family)
MESEPIVDLVADAPVERPPARWSGVDIAMAIGFSFAGLVAATLIGGLMVGLRTASGGGRTSLDLLILHGATSVAFLAASLAIIATKGYTLPQIGLGRVTAGQIGRWLLWAAAGTVIVTLCAAVLLPFGFRSGQSWRQFAPDGFTWSGAIGMTLVAGVAAPFYEEFFFRGMLFHWLRDHRGFWVAAIGSSILFGLAHFDVVVGLGTFVMGMLSSAAYHRTGSLWPSFLLHSFNNTLKVVGIYIALASGVDLDKLAPETSRIGYTIRYAHSGVHPDFRCGLPGSVHVARR